MSERRRLETERERASEEKGILLREIHHRVKNNLQVISSLFYLQARRTDDPKSRAMLDESLGRIQSIALVHDQLYRSPRLSMIDLEEYLTNLVNVLTSMWSKSSSAKVEVLARDVAIDIEHAIPCGMLVGELVTNSFKHAFPSGLPGHVIVRLERRPHPDHDGNETTLEVVDDGVGIPETFDWQSSPTLGLQLVQSLARQLGGSITREHSAKGTHFVIRFSSPTSSGANDHDRSQ
jgi:two-component sensor histidine kinase